MNAPDLEGLLIAMVLAPGTYARNRFFALHTRPEVIRVRRRAALVRGIIRHLGRQGVLSAGEIQSIVPASEGRSTLTYVVPSIGLVRRATLDPTEIALIRFTLARLPGHDGPLGEDDPDRLRIETALARLSPRLDLPPTSPPV